MPLARPRQLLSLTIVEEGNTMRAKLLNRLLILSGSGCSLSSEVSRSTRLMER